MADITLEWAGPFSLKNPEGCARFKPPPEPGIYVWVTGTHSNRRVSYVGETANLRTRMYQHATSMLGGGYWLYDVDLLGSGEALTGGYEPKYDAYYTEFVARWEDMSKLAFDNLASYEIFWATLSTPIDKQTRQTIESALISHAKKRSWAPQNVAVSRLPANCKKIRIIHPFPPDIWPEHSGSATAYGSPDGDPPNAGV